MSMNNRKQLEINERRLKLRVSDLEDEIGWTKGLLKLVRELLNTERDTSRRKPLPRFP